VPIDATGGGLAGLSDRHESSEAVACRGSGCLAGHAAARCGAAVPVWPDGCPRWV